MKHTPLKIGALAVSLALVAVACGGDDGDDSATTDEAVCPTNLVIQTDWWPEIEHGGTYQLIGAGGTSDPSLFT